MEKIHISILDKISLLSIIMPYYSCSHKSFLLLSTLSSKIRRNLSDFYVEFRKFMLKFCKEKEVGIKDLADLRLPMDLFKFKINSDSLFMGVEHLIAFVNTI